MEWVLINNGSLLIKEYHLNENGSSKVVAKYNPTQRSVRINCDGKQRLFFIESTGSLSNRYVFKNEYGFETGSMQYDKWNSSDGTVFIESHRYHYQFSNGYKNHILIFNDSKEVLLNCDAQATTQNDHPSLLLALCWYLETRAVAENRRKHFTA